MQNSFKKCDYKRYYMLLDKRLRFFTYPHQQTIRQNKHIINMPPDHVVHLVSLTNSAAMLSRIAAPHLKAGYW